MRINNIRKKKWKKMKNEFDYFTDWFFFFFYLFFFVCVVKCFQAIKYNKMLFFSSPPRNRVPIPNETVPNGYSSLALSLGPSLWPCTRMRLRNMLFPSFAAFEQSLSSLSVVLLFFACIPSNVLYIQKS